MNACADVGGADACEALTAERGGFGFFGSSTYVVISELVDSEQALSVRFRTSSGM